MFAGEARTGDGQSFAAAIKFAVGEGAPLVREVSKKTGRSMCASLQWLLPRCASLQKALS